jgi:septal ring-binding cell division protein DamX
MTGMRFEIRTGGTILILVGLMGLSGAVFALGLVAGYEMARQNTPDISQVASVFPVPSAPPMPPSAVASPAVASAALPTAAPAASPAPMAASTAGNLARPVLSSKAAAPGVTPKAMAARTTPAVRPAPAEEEATGESAPAKPAPHAAASVASAAPAAQSEARKKGYNIQIEAVMDHSGAEDMIRRLRALGYTPYEVETKVNGQTWYRVRVGPYASPEAARAAQDKLKEQYKAAYMSR